MKRRKKNIIFENDRTVLQAVQFSDAGEKSKAILVPEIDHLDEISSYKKLREKRIKKAITRIIIWSFIFLLLPVFVFYTVVIFSPNSGHNFFGYTFYYVTSESMVPEIDVHDMIVVKTNLSLEEINVGSDITFVRESDGKIVTHRVMSYVDTPQGRVYTTKGVNNNFYDAPVNFNNIMGVKLRVCPILGDIITFLRSPIGMVVLFSFFGSIMVGIYISFRISNDIRAVGK